MLSTNPQHFRVPNQTFLIAVVLAGQRMVYPMAPMVISFWQSRASHQACKKPSLARRHRSSPGDSGAILQVAVTTLRLWHGAMRKGYSV